MVNLLPENKPLVVDINGTKTPLKPHVDIIADTWESVASMRATWGKEIWRGTIHYENNRLKNTNERRVRNKNKMNTEADKPAIYITHLYSKYVINNFGIDLD